MKRAGPGRPPTSDTLKRLALPKGQTTLVRGLALSVPSPGPSPPSAASSICVPRLLTASPFAECSPSSSGQLPEMMKALLAEALDQKGEMVTFAEIATEFVLEKRDGFGEGGENEGEEFEEDEERR